MPMASPGGTTADGGSVRDVMTTPVVTVDRRTPCKRIAALRARHQIGAVPVPRRRLRGRVLGRPGSRPKTLTECPGGGRPCPGER